MNIFSSLFGIFRQRGLVSTIKANGSLTGYFISAALVSIIGAILYGFAMGIGLGSDTAIYDAIKTTLIITLANTFSIPIFWVAYRLLGREERLSQVAAVPMTTVSTISIILAVTAPVVFMLSVLTGFNPNVIYIHIVIIDIALLVGLYLSGMLIYHSFDDHKRLIIPNVVGFIMMAVILVVLISFLSPFLEPRPTFSVGTDRLKDSLGIGVFEKINRSLAGAASSELIQYRYQSTNQNGDLIQDYTVTIVGNDDYLVGVHLHAQPNDGIRTERQIWVLDGQTYTDFDEGMVTQVDPDDLNNILKPALPPVALTLPQEFKTASWRAYVSGSQYHATGISRARSQADLVLEADTGRLVSLTLGSADTSAHAETFVKDINPPELDRRSIESMLNKALLLGSLDQSDASMQNFVQAETFFVVRYPHTWRSGSWISSEKPVKFFGSCKTGEICPSLEVKVYDLVEASSIDDYAEALAHSLDLQPEYRDFRIRTTNINEANVGIVEYFFDEFDKDEVKTTHHLEYIFVGQEYRYHLDFAASEEDFESFRGLFDEISQLFIYLK